MFIICQTSDYYASSKYSSPFLTLNLKIMDPYDGRTTTPNINLHDTGQIMSATLRPHPQVLISSPKINRFFCRQNVQKQNSKNN